MALGIKAMVGILLSVVVFAALAPTMADQIWQSHGSAAAGNVTGAAATLLALGMLFVAIVFIYGLVKSVR